MKKTLYDTALLALIFGLLHILSTVMFAEDVEAQQLSRGEIELLITKSALRNGVDPDLALAIVEVESKFNVNAVGSIGEIGLFQLRPEYHRVQRGRAKENIETGVRYLAHLQRLCGDYGDAFFVCFNYGPARKLKHPRLFPYYKKVKQAQYRRQAPQNVIATRD